MKPDSRPACINPECGASGIRDDGHHVISSSGPTRWLCTECGKKFNKNLDVNNSDLHRYIHEPHLTGDYMIFSDPHYPFYHEEAHHYAMKLREKWKLKKVLIPGDGIDSDNLKMYVDRHPDVPTWKIEKEMVRKPLEWLASEFDRVDLLVGNHELRMWKQLYGKCDQEDIFLIVLGKVRDDLRKKIKFHLYPVAVINNSWIVDHPNTSSVISGRVPERLSGKYLVQHVMEMLRTGATPKNGQIGYISTHGHLGGEGTDPSGEFQVADGMVMCDPDLFAYHKVKRTPRPEWRIGFNVIKNNYLYRFPLKNTDWKY